MGLGGLAYLASSFGPLLMPDVAGLANVSMLGGLAELVLTLWLLAFGVRATTWMGAQPLFFSRPEPA
jgi:hypothetical protein